MFSFFAEITFWLEFESRFNFIAVDYLIYTYEVINNINESYPLPLLISGILLLCILITGWFYKRNVFKITFNSNTPFTTRLLLTFIIVSLTILLGFTLNNSMAEKSGERYQNELSKAGIFSFFAAFKNNELSYDHFYKLIDIDKAFTITRNELVEENIKFTFPNRSIERYIKKDNLPQKPNVIMVTIESFSADFMGSFGNSKNLTPVLDSIAKQSILFTNMYATGTRTVRGMEALSLAVPPTPGSSIVRRPDNDHLLTIGNIFNKAGYESSFLYGGDGYFDNMNNYFGNNGYDVVDRGRNLVVKDNFTSQRQIIADSLVHFENAWGICDEDLYDASVRQADAAYARGKSFYHFVMTTSNHRPFTFPAGKIDLPSASGRDGAVKYTDYAIGAFLKKAKQKPWFQNTVFIFVADHCASSAGKNEIDIAKYHIPCIIYNPNDTRSQIIDKACSQVDLYPTLFSYLHWSYTSNLYGKNVLSPLYTPRIMLGTYQKLAYMKADSLVILSPQQKVETYIYNASLNTQEPAEFKNGIKEEAIAEYQTAYFLFKNKGLKQRSL
jgi:phosphoglycerol transferase MdoB-like AlkP superfamily enzyme